MALEHTARHQTELSRKHRLFADELARQGGADAIGPDLIERANRALRLCDLHWRYADDAEIRQWACAYSVGLRFRERAR